VMAQTVDWVMAIKTVWATAPMKWVPISQQFHSALVVPHLPSAPAAHTRVRCSTMQRSSVGVTARVAKLVQTMCWQLVMKRVRWATCLPLSHSAVAPSTPSPSQLHHKVLLRLRATRKRQCRGVHPLTTAAQLLPITLLNIRCRALVCGLCLTMACLLR